MSAQNATVRKVTISLPVSLIEFADSEAARPNISRSRLIARALSEIRAAEEKRLAAEGYQFYFTSFRIPGLHPPSRPELAPCGRIYADRTQLDAGDRCDVRQRCAND